MDAAAAEACHVQGQGFGSAAPGSYSPLADRWCLYKDAVTGGVLKRTPAFSAVPCCPWQQGHTPVHDVTAHADGQAGAHCSSWQHPGPAEPQHFLHDRHTHGAGPGGHHGHRH